MVQKRSGLDFKKKRKWLLLRYSWKIEDILRALADKVRDSEKICDIEDYLQDELSMLDCHVANRAGVEIGRIKE